MLLKNKKLRYILAVLILGFGVYFIITIFHICEVFASDTGLKFPTATGDDYNNWTDSTNAYADDASYALNGCNNGAGLSISLSWDGGVSYTSTQFQAFGGGGLSVRTTGGGADDWGRTWNYHDFSNTNFRVKFANPCGVPQDYYDFNFGIPRASIQGVEVVTEGSFSPNVYYIDYVQVKVYYTEITSTCEYLDPTDYNVLESDNCYITSDVYVNGKFNLIGSTTGQFGCAPGIKVSAENFNFGTAPTTFDMKCFAHH